MNRTTLLLGSALALSALVPAARAATATSLSSFGGIEEPARRYFPASNTFQSDSFVNITDVSSGTIQTLLRYNSSGTMWWDGDRTTSNTDRGRAEVKTLGPNQKINETFDYTTTWRTNSGFRGSGGFCHITQLKGVDGTEATSGAPLLVTSINSGTSSAVVRYASTSFSPHNVFTTRTVRNVTWSPNTWLDMRIRIKTTADGANTGQILVSLNGDSLQGLNNIEVSRPEAQTYYPKWGLYRKQETSSNFSPSDYIQHSNVSATKITSTTPVANPTFSPGGGTYSSAQSVTISTTTSGASIRYTLDGSTPSSTSGTLYSGPVSIAATATLRAIAYLSGSPDSAVTSATYTINIPAVASPTFNPGGGAYTSAQSVTISTATSGASIRYTLDGSTPTSTSGTLYSAPVNIAATATLRAIAYKSGSPDSAVTSATYTIGSPTLSWEAEALTRTSSGATTAPQNDANNSGGVWIALQADGVGDYVEYTLPNVPAGTYQLKMRYKGHPNRGILQASSGGVSIGGTLDQYSATSIYPEQTLGNVTFSGGTANRVVRLTVTGRNGSSGAYTLSSDTFTLVPATTPPPTVNLEAESASPVGTGATVTTGNETAASGGVVVYLNADGVGDHIEFTTPSLAAGTYQLRFRFKRNTARGQHTVTVDGAQVGGTIDQYGASGYVEVTVGNVTFASAGAHTIRLTVTGRNASSSSYVLAPYCFTFAGQ